METLTRVGRSQVFGTLLLYFGLVLLSAFDSQLQFLLPSLGSDSGELLTRILVLASGGFFVGFLLENAIDTVGYRVAGFVCERTRTDFQKHEAQTQEDVDLDLILRNEPVLTGVIKGKPALMRFVAVARYLSQERFKDFPELSPLRAFEDAMSFSMAAVGFLGLAILGLMSGLVVGREYWDSARVTVVLLCALVAVLLWFNARRHHDEGRESTLISMRERRAEAEKSIQDAAKNERAAAEAKKAAEAEAENRRLSLDILNRSIKDTLVDIDSDNPSQRGVGTTTLSSIVQTSLALLDFPGEHFQNLLKALGMAAKLNYRNDREGVSTLLSTALRVVRGTQNPSVYDAVEMQLTPFLAEMILNGQSNEMVFRNAAELAANLRSPELVDAFLNRAVKDETGTILSNLRFDAALGQMALGHFNRDKVIRSLKSNPAFGEKSALRIAMTNIVSSLGQPEVWRDNLPKVLTRTNGRK